MSLLVVEILQAMLELAQERVRLAPGRLGRDDQLAQSSLRFSLGRYSTEAEVDFAIGVVREQVNRLRALGPGGTACADGREAS